MSSEFTLSKPFFDSTRKSHAPFVSPFPHQETRERKIAATYLPRSFDNNNVRKILNNSFLPTYWEEGSVSGYKEKGGRVVLVNSMTQECWDLLAKKNALDWRGKVSGKTHQIFPDGQRYVHLKKPKELYEKGAWKTCKLAEDFFTKEKVARLVIKLNKTGDPEILKRHLQGLWILHRLEGIEGIVERRGDLRAKNKRDEPIMVSYQRYYEFGSLKSFLIEHAKQINDEIAHHIAKQLLFALSQMHKRGVYHRDLKVDNVLISASKTTPGFYDAAFCDFDLSWIEGLDLGSGCGTPAYFAPERAHAAIKNTLDKTTKTDLEKNDVWGLGLILYTIYHKKSLASLKTMISHSSYQTMKHLAKLHGKEGTIFAPVLPIDSLIARMLELNPTKRLGSKEAFDLFSQITQQKPFDAENFHLQRRGSNESFSPPGQTAFTNLRTC